MSDTIEGTATLDEAPPRRLVRVDEGRWLGGVAAGLGRYFDVNPLVYRIAFAALALAGGTGLLLYLAAWLVMPGERSDESVAVETLRRHRERPWLLLGVGLLVFGALFALSEARFWPGTGNVWLAATLLGAALVWWHVGNRDEAAREPAPASPPASPPGAPAATPRPAAPRRPSLLAPVLGALLAAAGLLGLLAVLGVYEVDAAVAFAGAVVVVGAAVAVGAFTERRVGGLVVLGLLLLPAFGVAAAMPVSISAGVGEKVERPTATIPLQPSYELGLGELNLDLAGVKLPPGTTSVDASVGVGELVITVPDDYALEIDAQAGIGEVNVLGARDEGIDADRTITIPGSTPDAPVLDVEADVGIGYVEVRRR
jgi:phage shock protein PspC (stress-responsive transcriptional regulator)